MPSSETKLTDHQDIKDWVYTQEGVPARVRDTEGGEAGGIVRIAFPGKEQSETSGLDFISWDEWFAAFDEKNLALLIDESGDNPRFNKLVAR